jgi:hypothetical protein
LQELESPVHSRNLVVVQEQGKLCELRGFLEGEVAGIGQSRSGERAVVASDARACGPFLDYFSSIGVGVVVDNNHGCSAVSPVQEALLCESGEKS